MEKKKKGTFWKILLTLIILGAIGYGKYFGLDLDSGEAIDMLAQNVVEPLRVKVQAINSAEEVANMILRIDDVIAARRTGPAPPAGGMPDMGGMM